MMFYDSVPALNLVPYLKSHISRLSKKQYILKQSRYNCVVLGSRSKEQDIAKLNLKVTKWKNTTLN